jgi:hypothetical protein
MSSNKTLGPTVAQDRRAALRDAFGAQAFACLLLGESRRASRKGSPALWGVAQRFYQSSFSALGLFWGFRLSLADRPADFIASLPRFQQSGASAKR